MITSVKQIKEDWLVKPVGPIIAMLLDNAGINRTKLEIKLTSALPCRPVRRENFLRWLSGQKIKTNEEIYFDVCLNYLKQLFRVLQFTSWEAKYVVAPLLAVNCDASSLNRFCYVPSDNFINIMTNKFKDFDNLNDFENLSVVEPNTNELKLLKLKNPKNKYVNWLNMTTGQKLADLFRKANKSFGEFLDFVDFSSDYKFPSYRLFKKWLSGESDVNIPSYMIIILFNALEFNSREREILLSGVFCTDSVSLYNNAPYKYEIEAMVEKVKNYTITEKITDGIFPCASFENTKQGEEKWIHNQKRKQFINRGTTCL